MCQNIFTWEPAVLCLIDYAGSQVNKETSDQSSSRWHLSMTYGSNRRGDVVILHTMVLEGDLSCLFQADSMNGETLRSQSCAVV